MRLGFALRVIPYVTFVLSAFDYDGSPLLLLSDLSEHTKNLSENNSVSILFYEEQRNLINFPVFKNIQKKSNAEYYEDPMSRPRLTVMGNLKKSNIPNHKKRFLSRHPASQLYANFKDMNIYKLNISGGHLTGGFAKVSWFKKNELTYKYTSGFLEAENETINHMNECHQKSIDLFSRNIMGQKKSCKWKLIGIDPEGFDMRHKEKLLRLNFIKSLKNSDELRKAFIMMHKFAEK